MTASVPKVNGAEFGFSPFLCGTNLLFSKGPSMLLYGEPGVGKTATAG